MLVYPAIDLIDGKCVRLTLGDFETSKIYNDNPANMLEIFEQHGFDWVHIVDLDGAKTGSVKQTKLIATLAENSQLNIQVGGGIRTAHDIDKLLNSGVKRVVLGSICVSQPQLVKSWFEVYGSELLVLALDCTLNQNGIPVIKTHGWQESSGKTIWDLLDFYHQAKYVLCTDISVDGTLSGPNLNLYDMFMRKYPQIKLIASGGVGSMSDLVKLSEMNVYGVVVGKAIYEGKINITDINKMIRI